MLFDLSILIALTMVMRIAPRLFFPHVIPNSDTYFHMAKARYFYKNRNLHPMEWKGMKGNGYYPFLYHIILGLGGKRYQAIFEKLSSPLWDAIAISSIYIFSSRIILVSADSAKYAGFPFWLAILYGTSPMLFQRETGPRSFEGTPRSLGETLFLLMVLAGLSPLYYDVPHWLGIGTAAILGALMLLTSKFSLQAFFFLAIPAAALSNRMDMLVFPLLVLLTAILISHGAYIKILKLHFIHLYTYAVQSQKIMPHMMDRNNPIRIIKKAKEIIKAKQYTRLLAIPVRDITPTAMIYKSPQFIFSTLILLNLIGSWGTPEGLNMAIYETWFWAALFPMFFTAFYPFLFLGEVERYQDYTFYPQYLFITLYLWEYDLFGLFFGVQMVLYLLHATNLISKMRQKAFRNKQLRNMVDFINNNYSNEISAIIIYSESTHETGYYLNNISTYPDSITQSGDYVDSFYMYPYLHPDKLQQFVNKQNAKLIIVDRTAIRDMAEKHNKPYDLTLWPNVVFSNELFFILEVEQACAV